MSAMQIGIQQLSQLRKIFDLDLRKSLSPQQLSLKPCPRVLAAGPEHENLCVFQNPSFFLITFPFHSHNTQWIISLCGTKGCSYLGRFLFCFQTQDEELASEPFPSPSSPSSQGSPDTVQDSRLCHPWPLCSKGCYVFAPVNICRNSLFIIINHLTSL